MKKIEFKKEKIPFTQVANAVLNDSSITFRAKGVYAYLYSKPDGWDFSIDRIALETKEERKAINSALKELENAGLLTRKRQGDGRVVYEVHFPPITQMSKRDIGTSDPNVRKGKVPKRQSAEKGMISNKESIIINNISNKDSKAVALQGKQWNELIDGFKEINPLYEDFYRNTTERKSLQHLVDRLGYNKVIGVIKHLPEITRQTYAPKITKPSELRRDLGRLIIFYKQNQNQKTKYGGNEIY